MKGVNMWKGFIAIFIMITTSQWALASEGKPLCDLTFNHTVINPIQSDTLPPPAKNTVSTTDKPVQDILKVVPKARKQPVPIPVNVKVNPIKIIKPKIIKPIIRVLH